MGVRLDITDDDRMSLTDGDVLGMPGRPRIEWTRQPSRRHGEPDQIRVEGVQVAECRVAEYGILERGDDARLDRFPGRGSMSSWTSPKVGFSLSASATITSIL